MSYLTCLEEQKKKALHYKNEIEYDKKEKKVQTQISCRQFPGKHIECLAIVANRCKIHPIMKQ
jgi:hypothetical protein